MNIDHTRLFLRQICRETPCLGIEILSANVLISVILLLSLRPLDFQDHLAEKDANLGEPKVIYVLGVKAIMK